jgi:hypothetical protein
MASNPPFHMEDQTDEDFFDKLVEDDDDDMVPVKSTHHDEGNDSDDAKAFANLNINDVDAATFENSGAGESGVEVKEELDIVKSDVGLIGGHDEQVGNPVVVSSSVECDSKPDLGNEEIGVGSEFTAVPAVGENNDVASSGIKEKDWNSFHADANDGTGFGSYSDFFSELGDQSGDFPAISHDNLNIQASPVNEAQMNGLNTSVDYLQYQQYEGVQGYDTSFGNHTDKQGDGLNTSVSYLQHQEGGAYDASSNQQSNGQDLSSSQNWEDLYPGWKYDHSTGQWYQIDGYNATATSQQTSEANAAVDWAAASDGKTEISYLQQTAQSVAGTLAETGTTESVSSWNQVSQANNGYPEHMVFDPQYPGWYYDTIAQEWRSLETYNSSVQSSVHGLENGHTSTSTSSALNDNNSLYSEYSQAGNYGSQGVGSQAVNGTWSGSYGVNQQQGFDMYTTDATTKIGDNRASGGNQQVNHSYGSNMSGSTDQVNTSSSFGSVPLYNKAHGLANGTFEPKTFAPRENISQQFNYSNTNFDEQKQFSNVFAENQNSHSYSQQSIQGGHQYPYAPHAGRSSAGRPSHALVTFGFGGKLIIMKDPSALSASYGSQVNS